jgi:hypothetical protein
LPCAGLHRRRGLALDDGDAAELFVTLREARHALGHGVDARRRQRLDHNDHAGARAGDEIGVPEVQDVRRQLLARRWPLRRAARDGSVRPTRIQGGTLYSPGAAAGRQGVDHSKY